MIEGSSAFQNIHLSPVTAPYIGAYLKEGDNLRSLGYRVGSTFSGTTVNIADGVGTVFKNRYVFFLRATGATVVSAFGLSGWTTALHTTANLNGVTINSGYVPMAAEYVFGLSANDLGTAKFITDGDTLSCYYYGLTGNGGVAGASQTFRSFIRRISTNDGLNWSGQTEIYSTLAGMSFLYMWGIAPVSNDRIYFLQSNAWDAAIAIPSFNRLCRLQHQSGSFGFTVLKDNIEESTCYSNGLSTLFNYATLSATYAFNRMYWNRINAVYDPTLGADRMIIREGKQVNVDTYFDWDVSYSEDYSVGGIRYLEVDSLGNVFNEKEIIPRDYNNIMMGAVTKGLSYYYLPIRCIKPTVGNFILRSADFENWSLPRFVPLDLGRTALQYATPMIAVAGTTQTDYEVFLLAPEVSKSAYAYTVGQTLYDISNEIISYSNNDNESITLEISNT